MHDYDIGIIGGGPAGYVAAIRAAQLGAKTVLVEKERVGGTCLNRGCIPTKALVESAALYQKTLRATDFGIQLNGSPNVDFAQMTLRKQQIVDRLVSSVQKLLQSHGVEVMNGEGVLVSEHEVGVRTESAAMKRFSCRSVVLAPGSKPAWVELEGFHHPGVVDSRGLLDLKEQPRSLIVIGASVVGMEMASIFHNLGTRVTVLGRRTFLKSVDPQLAKRYRVLAARRGLRVETGVDFQRIERLENGQLRLHYRAGSVAKAIEAEMILLATGQEPLTTGIGLEEAGVVLDNAGFIAVDSRMRTSVPWVYAAGDAIGGWMLAHVASHEGIVAVENALGHERSMDYRAVPTCVYTDPEIASVGMTEEDAKMEGFDAAVARFPFGANGRALTMGEEEGQIRLVYDRASGRVLGVHAMGPHASELSAEGAVAVKTGVTVNDLADTLHQHPTLSEVVMEASMAAVTGEAIHYRQI